MPRPVPAAVALILLVTVVLAPVPSPAGTRSGAPRTAQTAVTDVHPPPRTVVEAGTVALHATLPTGTDPSTVRVEVRGEPVPARAETSDRGVVVRSSALAPDGTTTVTVSGVADGAAVQRSWEFDATALRTTRIAGRERIATAAAVASHRFPVRRTAESALVARADDPADALAAASLARHLHAPVLLATVDGLPEGSAEALRRLLPRGATVHLLGGTAVLSDDVVNDVAALGYEPTRLAGDGRAATAAAIAEELPASVEAVVGPAGRPLQALAAATFAAAEGVPLLLVDPHGVPPATRGALDGIERVTVVGSDDVVPAAVEDELRRLVPDVVRVAAGVEGTAELVDAAVAAAVAELPSPDGGTGAPVGLVGANAGADAATAAALLAERGAPLLLAASAGRGSAALPETTWRAVAARAPDEVIAVGGHAPVPPDAIASARAARRDGPAAPTAVVEAPTGTAPDGTVPLGEVDLRVDRPVDAVALHVSVDGREIPGTASAVDGGVAWRPDVIPSDLPRAVALPLRLTGVVAAGGHGRHVDAAWPVVLPPATTTSPEGFVVAGGGSGPVGDGALRRFTVEVEPSTGIDVHALVDVAEAALYDARSWTGRGQWALQRVDDPAAAHIRVVLARPATVDRFCGRAGLDTAGIYSCWDGRRAMLNLDRYQRGAPPFHSDLAVYRGYLVNHEFGHGLGYGHVGCPARGAPAPVMMQQTKGVAPCTPNAWPYP